MWTTSSTLTTRHWFKNQQKKRQMNVQIPVDLLCASIAHCVCRPNLPTFMFFFFSWRHKTRTCKHHMMYQGETRLRRLFVEINWRGRFELLYPQFGCLWSGAELRNKNLKHSVVDDEMKHSENKCGGQSQVNSLCLHCSWDLPFCLQLTASVLWTVGPAAMPLDY